MSYLYDFNLNMATAYAMSNMLGCHNGTATDIRAGIVLTNSSKNYFTVCIPILSGTIGISLDKLLPIGQLSDDIRIEISLEGNTTAFCASTNCFSF